MHARSIAMRPFCQTVAWLSALTVVALTLGCAHHDKVVTPLASAPQAPKAQAPAASPEPAADAPRPVMDQKALDRLKAMSQTLTSARSFSYRSRSMTEVPATTGQNLTVFTHADVALQRPNKLRATVSGDVPSFQMVYDGATVSALDPQKNLYAVTAAPATIDETLVFLMEKSGIHFPASEVLYSDPYAVMAKDLNSAFVVGPSDVDGFACDHLAFMAPGVNWEVWIDAGRVAVPRRMAVTYKDATNFPRFLLEFSDWNLKARLSPASFVFKKPADARRIDFAPRIDAGAQEPGAPK
jgi:hypothetical protein